ncbi:hypothetical protein RHMOL_Rhmol04G0306300 [Rhododendron molle]|uniref:Uncharacterized protein n=1 Tax=Rhododendron molle TaxID=49168 RepID=A0ACC0P5V0_RHOML|nr:hypothetical protein RHMOL_Rhmol04G0306300 [Rhododendron molle]
MAFPKSLLTKLFIVLVLLFSSSTSLQLAKATRPVRGETWRIVGMKVPVIQSLQRGPVTPSGSNPSTYIPRGR